jgi:hypothetical protein
VKSESPVKIFDLTVRAVNRQNDYCKKNSSLLNLEGGFFISSEIFPVYLFARNLP